MRLAILVFFTACLASCSGDDHLRGDVSLSDDGKTYFTVIEDNGEYCYPIELDGNVWGHKLGEIMEIAPGIHTIEACGEIQFEIPEGAVFKFDYWGP